MTTTSMTVALADLEPDEAINARRTRTDEGIDELKASIRAHGLIQALRVRHAEGEKARIIAGHRRHRVLCELAADGDSAGGVVVTPSFPVPVIFGDVDDTAAREISQAENFIRLPQHEADTYETFRDLADHGLDQHQIAARFGIDPKRVTRMLALGRLSPVILNWWREQEPNREVIGVVRAFTLASTVAEQERVFKKLRNQLWPHTIRHEFGAGDRTIGRHLDFVGKEVYLAAGGTVIEDLFDGDHAVSDPALVKKLVAEKLQAQVDALIADGWSWAALDSDLPGNWSYMWQKLPVSKKKATKADKAKAGAVVKLDYQGKLEITYGVVKPASEKPATTKAEGSKEKAEPTISNAMAHRLSMQATSATRIALLQEPRLGLVALLAGFLTKRNMYDTGQTCPIRVHHSGMNHQENGGSESFAAAFARLSGMDDQDLFRTAAGIAGNAVDLQVQASGHLPFDKAPGHLAAAIDADRMTAALKETFDAADYFDGASKPFVIQAIREAINEDEARRVDKMKKAELVAFALANVPQTGWLPPELRAPTYSGPGAVPVLTQAPATEPDHGETDDDPDYSEIDEEQAA